jgi:hypothetical protein
VRSRSALLAGLLVAAAVTGCAPSSDGSGPATSAGCDALVPDDGILLGVSIDWTAQTLEDHAARWAPARRWR